MTESLRQYGDFVKSNSRFLLFGILMTLGSSYGQTFFIAIFNAELRQEYGLSHGQIGSYYSVATVLSAIAFVWAGRLVDTMSLKSFSVLVICALAAASMIMSLSTALFWLPVAFFGLRLAGQGLMTHAALTAAAKSFRARRGTALSLVSLGFPLGQAIFPVIGVAMTAAIGWRQTWLLFAIALLVFLLPAVVFLLSQNQTFGRSKTPEAKKSEEAAPHDETQDVAYSDVHHWTRSEVVRDIRFYLVQPAMLAMPIIGTGVIWNITLIADSKSWDLELIAASLSGMALMQAVVTLGSGPLIDRFGAMPLLPLSLLPTILCLVLLAVADVPVMIFPIMLLLGLSLGLIFPTSIAMWAELYGVLHLGAIRALSGGLTVFGTAVSPALMGLLTDWGISIEVTALLLAAYAVAAGLLAVTVCGFPKLALSSS